MSYANRVVPILLLSAASAAHAQDVVDTFTNGVNLGSWGFHGPDEYTSPVGGNPGGYFRSTGLDTTIPTLRCLEGCPFTGNYRAMGVVAASIDVNVFETDFNIGAFPVTVILISDNGTPNDPDDDWGAFGLGDAIPMPGTGWKHISIDIPSQSTTPPVGWGDILFGSSFPPITDWNRLITNVTRVEFSFGDPSHVYIFQMWTVGADNVRLAIQPPCYANCDASTSPPILNINDFQCFLNLFATASPAANCDGSTQAPVLNVNDFQCFVNAFATGCP